MIIRVIAALGLAVALNASAMAGEDRAATLNAMLRGQKHQENDRGSPLEKYGIQPPEGLSESVYINLMNQALGAEVEGWEYVTRSDNAAWYIHRDTVIHSDDTIQAWFLTNKAIEKEDDPSDQDPAHLSKKTLAKFKCDQRVMAIVSSSLFRKRDGSGKVVASRSTDLPEFFPVSPDSIGEASLTSACAGPWDRYR